MRRLLVPLTVPLAVSLALLGCSDSSSSDDEGAGTGATVEDVTGDATTTTVAEDSSGPAIDLLDAGAEPRTQLRLALVPGSTTTYTSSTTVDQTVNGAAPGPITTTFTITTEVLSAEGGTAQVRSTYSDTDVDTAATAGPEVSAGAEATAALLNGAQATLSVDDQGRISDADFQAGTEAGAMAESIIDSLLDSLTNQSIVLPDDAIGVGGQWVLRSIVDAEGVVTDSEQTFTVAAIDEAGVDLTFTITGRYSGAATGTTSGSGTVRVTFDSFYPDTESTSTNTMTAQGSDVVQEITQSVHRN